MTQKSLICTQKLRIPKPTQFGYKMVPSHQKFQTQLDNNVRILLAKYPLQPGLKIKELLEELNNNVQMVEDLLQQQALKVQTESRKRLANFEKQKNHEQQNKMLKKALASLYSKLKKSEQESKYYKQKAEKEQKQKQFYKNRSNLLSSQQFNYDFDNNLHIY